jgi:hypothetical protein
MNERIKELAEQALEETHRVMGSACLLQCLLQEAFDDFYTEKFAELIVKECANFAYDYTSNEENVADFHDVGWDCLPGQLRSELKKHLGVEE